MMWVHICIPLNMHVAVEARTGFVVLDLGFGDEGGLCALLPFEECYGNGAAGQCAGLAGGRGDTGIVELVPCLLFYSGDVPSASIPTRASSVLASEALVEIIGWI